MSIARFIFLWFAAWFVVGALVGVAIFGDSNKHGFTARWFVPAIVGAGIAVVASSGVGAIVLVVRDVRRRG